MSTSLIFKNSVNEISVKKTEFKMIQLNAFTCIFIKSSDPTADKIFFFHDDQIPNTNA